MTVTTYEGIVEKGKILLQTGVRLPERTKVLVFVPDSGARKSARVSTPRLVHPEQAADFKLEISEDDSNNQVRR